MPESTLGILQGSTRLRQILEYDGDIEALIGAFGTRIS